MLKRALTDNCKKVRAAAIESLLRVDIPEERKIKELVPLVIPMLDDRSGRVRRRAAWVLSRYPAQVPVEAAVRAVLKDPKGARHYMLSSLLNAVSKGK